MIACRDCAAVQGPPSWPVRGVLQCRRCGGVLERTTGRSLGFAFGCGLASLVFLVPANTLPLLSVHLGFGQTRSTYLASGCFELWDQGWPMVAVVLGLQGIVLPFVHFGLLVSVLATLRWRVRTRWAGRAFRYAERLEIWAMVDVLVIGAVIGYGRVATSLSVRVEAGGWCFLIGGILTMLTRATVDRGAVWQGIAPVPQDTPYDGIACVACELVAPGVARACPRCGAGLHRRKRFAIRRSGALVAAAFLLLPVANYFPATTLWEIGQPRPHTIFDGVKLLFRYGYAPVGLLILMTSLAFPLLKLCALTWFAISTRRGSQGSLRFRTQFYRLISNLGRWSNIDPFTVMIFVPMVQFRPIAHIDIGAGAPAFVAVIVLSMVAVRLFDPRLMWDAACRADSDT